MYSCLGFGIGFSWILKVGVYIGCFRVIECGFY